MLSLLRSQIKAETEMYFVTWEIDLTITIKCKKQKKVHSLVENKQRSERPHF